MIRLLQATALLALSICACSEGGQGSDDGSPRTDGGNVSSSGNFPPIPACQVFEIFACCAWGCRNPMNWRQGSEACVEDVSFDLGTVPGFSWSGSDLSGRTCFRDRVEALHPGDADWSVEHWALSGPRSDSVCAYLTREACDEAEQCVDELGGSDALVSFGLPEPGESCPLTLIDEDAGP